MGPKVERSCDDGVRFTYSMIIPKLLLTKGRVKYSCTTQLWSDPGFVLALAV